MLTFDLKVGYSCNNDCKHCVIADSRDKLINLGKSIDLTTAECVEQIEQAASNGAKNIVLTGGEVTIRNDLLSLLNKSKDLGLGIRMQTNGRLLSNLSLIESVKAIQDIHFIVALHGPDATTHDSITQRAGSFEETVQGITSMTGIEKKVIGKMVISKMNKNQLTEVLILLNDLGVKHVCLAFPHGQGGARVNFDELIPRYSDIADELKKAIQKAEELKMSIEFEAIPFCIIPNYPYLVGELQYLGEGGTFFAQVHEEILEWNCVRLAIKKKTEKCEACFYAPLCEGPWEEYIDRFGDADLSPVVAAAEEKEKLQYLLAQIK
ncbi:radical SAM protein [Heliobacterium chlorum]|uniref:Radical SAM protein n=1 Tax=Heliobacterium chlorum TaxID=2698 RepID=A0ABR7T0I2_HELCL|nr:radical SAM protein [Heliobacterium chlorum]MBC9784303.1 radical SAM protein [Heliobacterium chlorum]